MILYIGQINSINNTPKSRMWVFLVLTGVLLFGVVYGMVKINQNEVLDHWAEYNKNPFFVFFLAPFYKPDNDERSRFQFSMDNFYNVLMSFCDDTMQVLMQPIMAIFKLMTDAIDQTVSGLFNVRGLLKVMWTRFNSMTDVFNKRFQASLTALRATYMKLYSAIGKTFAISVAGLMSGMAALQTTLSLFDLLVNVVLTILVILAAIFIWLPFILIPVIIIIILCVNAINDSGQGDKITGIAGVFCFAEGTQVETHTGTAAIETIQLGDRLGDGGLVNAVLMFDTPLEDMYDLYGVKVSGSHIVYTETGPRFVKAHPDAVKLLPNADGASQKVYCFVTTTRRIPVKTVRGPMEFADWEEIENSVEDLKEWNRRIFALLNPNQTYRSPATSTLLSESGCTGGTRIPTPHGDVEAREIHPGSVLLDEHGEPTRVRGVVRLSGREVVHCVPLGPDAYMSSGTWYRRGGSQWAQSHGIGNRLQATEVWYQFFTDAGTFCVATELAEGGRICVRDFTDVGNTDIQKTYSWVLETLAQKI